jgi:hypothetical protein
MFERLKKMSDLFWFLGIIGLWLLLQLVILPKLGFQT